MPEDIFIKFLVYLNYGYSINTFDENGYYLSARKRINWTFPWSRQNKFFNDTEKFILKEFVRTIKVNDEFVFQLYEFEKFSATNKRIKNPRIYFPLYKDLENYLIMHYENLTRKRLDRKKIKFNNFK